MRTCPRRQQPFISAGACGKKRGAGQHREEDKEQNGEGNLYYCIVMSEFQRFRISAAFL